MPKTWLTYLLEKISGMATSHQTNDEEKRRFEDFLLLSWAENVALGRIVVVFLWLTTSVLELVG